MFIKYPIQKQLVKSEPQTDNNGFQVLLIFFLSKTSFKYRAFPVKLNIINREVTVLWLKWGWESPDSPLQWGMSGS